MAVESHSVTPEVHAAAAAGTAPYPGQTEPKAPEAPAEGTEVKPEGTSETTSEQEETATAEGTTPDDAAEAVQEAAEAAGLDYEGLYSEFSTNGALSEESIASIKESLPGVTDEMLAVHLMGLQALANAAIQQGHSLVGGTENYAAMTAWAAKSLPKAEVAAFNSALQAGEDSAKLAITGLYARFSGGQGTEPSLVHTARKADGVPPIRSRQDLMLLQRDPRYAKDASYRQSVDSQVEIAIRSGQYKTY
jgi:hypothetical protein